MTELELLTYRWVQFSKVEFGALKEQKKVPINLHPKHTYNCNDSNIEMVEFHVDDADYFHEYCNEKYIYGGNLSVRKDNNKKPILLVGQDECIYYEYARSKKQWVSSEGKRALLPKTTGNSIMISAFQCREFGFGMEINEEDMVKINDIRRGTKYSDENAATAVYGTADKQDLKTSPFITYFQFGGGNEGYWDYNHMILQMEDCMDCLSSMYNEFDVVFLMDHSSGHAKKRVNGLDAQQMNVEYGGSQSRQRDTLISSYDGICGMYHDINNTKHVKQGEFQKLCFPDDNNVTEDDGPFWMTAEERIQF